jgi:hypothetical protein
VALVARVLALVLVTVLAASASGCAGCENSVCCALPGHVIPNVLRPSACTSMGGTAVDVSMCDVICCQAMDGTLSASPRMSCREVVESRLCDAPDGS